MPNKTSKAALPGWQRWVKKYLQQRKVDGVPVYEVVKASEGGSAQILRKVVVMASSMRATKGQGEPVVTVPPPPR